nr:hypothetical protein BaRGS_014279 [Batillaria attramentaria]
MSVIGAHSLHINRLKGRRRDGTPDKSATPSQDPQDENRPPSRQIIWDEEVEKMQIKADDLDKVRAPQPPTEPAPLSTAHITVRKMKPASELNKPKLKSVMVAKPASPEAPLKPVDYSGYAGPRYDSAGRVIPHSILGSYEDYHKEATQCGDLLDIPTPRIDDAFSDNKPTLKYEKKRKPVEQTPRKADENNALRNWQLRMLERKRQQGYISKLLLKDQEDLVMNQAETYRQTQEERYLIERTIPFVDYGKGYRVGSEFFKQQERFGDELSGVHMTLTQSERGYPPPVEYVGIPDVVRKEKGQPVGIEARVTFEAYTGNRITSYLEVINDGTTSVFYDWKRPVLCGGAALVLTLRGLALQEDKFEKKREELERELDSKQSQQVATQLLEEILSGVRTPKRAQSPVDAYITEEEIFHRNNPGMFYRHDAVQEMKQIHQQLYPEEEQDTAVWDLCVLDLQDMIMELDDEDERKESLLAQMNATAAKLTFAPPAPSHQKLLNLCRKGTRPGDKGGKPDAAKDKKPAAAKDAKAGKAAKELLELGALLEDMLCRLLAGAATALCIGGQSELPVRVWLALAGEEEFKAGVSLGREIEESKIRQRRDGGRARIVEYRK